MQLKLQNKIIFYMIIIILSVIYENNYNPMTCKCDLLGSKLYKIQKGILLTFLLLFNEVKD